MKMTILFGLKKIITYAIKQLHVNKMSSSKNVNGLHLMKLKYVGFLEFINIQIKI